MSVHGRGGRSVRGGKSWTLHGLPRKVIADLIWDTMGCSPLSGPGGAPASAWRGPADVTASPRPCRDGGTATKACSRAGRRRPAS